MADVDEDVSPLSDQLSALLVAYRDVLVFAERLPRLGRVRIRRSAPPILVRDLPQSGASLAVGSRTISGISRLELDPKTGRSKYLDEWDTRWMCRPLVCLYVHGHVRRHAENLCWQTRLQTLGSGKVDDSTRAVIAEFDRLVGLRSWRYLGRAATRIPVISSLIPAVSGIIVAITLGAGNADDVDKLTRAATIVGIVALVMLVTIWLPSVLLGFNAKRQLLSGDLLATNTASVDPDGSAARAPSTRQPDLPKAVTYHLENVVYDTLQIRKPTEFSLDILIRTAVGGYLQLGLIALYAIFLATRDNPFDQPWYEVGSSLAISGMLIASQCAVLLSAAGREIIEGPREWRDRRLRRLR